MGRVLYPRGSETRRTEARLRGNKCLTLGNTSTASELVKSGSLEQPPMDK